MEGQFEQLLHEITPTPDVVYLIRSITKQVWQEHHDSFEIQHRAIERELKDTDKKIEQFLDRIVEADNASLIKAYESKITKLENEKAVLSEKLTFGEEMPTDFESNFQTVFDFIEKPQKLWGSEDIEDKRLVLKLVFTRPLQYRRNEGFQTAAISLPFALSRDLMMGKSGMVEHSGVEPLTSCMPCKRSTN